jgi:hypothetical protein
MNVRPGCLNVFVSEAIHCFCNFIIFRNGQKLDALNGFSRDAQRVPVPLL